MKKAFILLFVPIFLGAQNPKISESEVPESVRSSFSTLFPGAKALSWEQEEYGLYEAELRWKGYATSVTFNANGLLQRTEKEVKKSELPGDVTAHARKMFPDHRIAECQIVTTPDKRELYEVEMVKGKERQSLIFDENNTFLRIEVDEDDDDVKKPRKKG